MSIIWEILSSFQLFLSSDLHRFKKKEIERSEVENYSVFNAEFKVSTDCFLKHFTSLHGNIINRVYISNDLITIKKKTNTASVENYASLPKK